MLFLWKIILFWLKSVETFTKQIQWISMQNFQLSWDFIYFKIMFLHIQKSHGRNSRSDSTPRILTLIKKELRMNIFTNVKNATKHSNMDSLSHIIKEHTVVFLLAMKMWKKVKLMTCFHEFSQYETTNFFYQILYNTNLFFSKFSYMFLNLNDFSNLNSNCSNLLDMRNL